MTEYDIHECLSTAPAVRSTRQLRIRAAPIQTCVACFAPHVTRPRRYQAISIYWQLLTCSKSWRIPLLLSGEVTDADQTHPHKEGVWGTLLLWPAEKRDSAREILGA